MGRKSNRDLWTAKLAGRTTPGITAAGRQPVAGSGGSVAAVTGAATAAAAKTGGASLVAKAGVAGGQALSLAAARRKSAASHSLAQTAYGTRQPFHGVVLGIDPSLRGTGIAVVRFSPPEQPRLLYSVTVRNKPALSPAQCLGNIARAVQTAIETYNPLCVSLEQTVYVQNVKTSLILGSARGAAIAPAAMRGLEIFEYAPTRMKQAVVGSGRASKEQVAAMVRSLVQAGRDLLPSDEADAAAAAICHAFTTRL